MFGLTVTGLTKEYEGKALLRDVGFTVLPGETMCLLGKSGSGKSTILRIIAGIEQPENGKVLWNGEEINNLPVHQRNFSLMFQDYALFPHLSVRENVAFGPRMRGIPREEREQIVIENLAKVNMSSFVNRRVTDLSGGEQQRIALARALAAKPALLMLDEPLAALDHALRVELQAELRSLLHNAAIPVIYVTHDQEEAMVVGDHLAILHDGVIVQAGETEQVFQQPASRWAAEFLGMTNFINGEVISVAPLQVRTDCGILFPGGSSLAQVISGQRVTLLVQPTGVSLNSDRESLNKINGRVISSVFRGTHHQLTIQVCGGQEFSFICGNPYETGEKIILDLSPASLMVIA